MNVRMYRKSMLVLAVAACFSRPLLSSADTSGAKGSPADYVVLTDLSEDDPCFAAASRLQRHRKAQIVRFPTGNVADALGPLRHSQPTFAAVVVRPKTLDVNFAYDVLELAWTVDDDPFADFAYGFITGATAEDALALVERGIMADSGASPSNGLLVAFGPTSTPQADDGNAFEWLPGWRRLRIEHKPKGFPWANLPDLAAADAIRFWGHGAPDSVDGSLKRSDLDGLDLRARVVFAGPCFSAVTRRYYESPACSSKLEARCVGADRSLALAFFAKDSVRQPVSRRSMHLRHRQRHPLCPSASPGRHRHGSRPRTSVAGALAGRGEAWRGDMEGRGMERRTLPAHATGFQARGVGGHCPEHHREARVGEPSSIRGSFSLTRQGVMLVFRC